MSPGDLLHISLHFFPSCMILSTFPLYCLLIAALPPPRFSPSCDFFSFQTLSWLDSIAPFFLHDHTTLIVSQFCYRGLFYLLLTLYLISLIIHPSFVISFPYKLDNIGSNGFCFILFVFQLKFTFRKHVSVHVY